MWLRLLSWYTRVILCNVPATNSQHTYAHALTSHLVHVTCVRWLYRAGRKVYPTLDAAHGYLLNNWYVEGDDPTARPTVENTRAIRMFLGRWKHVQKDLIIDAILHF